MLIPTGPHGHSAQCIQALEQEIRRLQELLRVVKRSEKLSDDRSTTPLD
jgi:hypothetical protein